MIISCPILIMVHINPDTGLCIGEDITDKTIGIFYRRILLTIVFMFIPTLLLVVFNIVLVIKLK